MSGKSRRAEEREKNAFPFGKGGTLYCGTGRSSGAGTRIFFARKGKKICLRDLNEGKAGKTEGCIVSGELSAPLMT